MRIAPVGHRTYTYKVTVAPVNKPVSLALFKQHIVVTHSLQDDLLQVYLDAATSYAEKYTGRYLIKRTVRTFRDFFPRGQLNEGYYYSGQIPTGATNSISSYDSNVGFEIRKSPLDSIVSVEYLANDGSTKTVDPSNYYNTIETDYSELLSNDGFDWPHDAARREQSIMIDFICGMADDDSGIDGCWKTAIMEHAAMLWANRGDCSDSGCAKMLPAAAKAFYDLKRIRNL